jgi:hypothetical protein
VDAQPGEQGEVRGPLHHADRIELHRAHPAEDRSQVPQVYPSLGPGPGQALGGDRHPARPGEGERSHRPVKVGGRFSRKAAVASMKSALRNSGSSCSRTRGTWSR